MSLANSGRECKGQPHQNHGIELEESKHKGRNDQQSGRMLKWRLHIKVERRLRTRPSLDTTKIFNTRG